MLVTKNIDFLLNDDFFVGWESENHVGVGVMGTKEPNNSIINDLFEKYNNITFDENNMFSFSIPKILTKILKENYGLQKRSSENQKLKNNTCVYARDYFYPLEHNFRDNIFTDNTCMIHYFNASWTSKGERIATKLTRLFGKNTGYFIMQLLVKTKTLGLSLLRLGAYPLIKYRNKKRITIKINERDEKLITSLNEIKDKEYLVIHNPEWLGTTYATKELFKNTCPITEIDDKEYCKKVAKEIVKRKFKMVIFSAFAKGWEELAREIKNQNGKVIIKTIWHGSNAMHIEDYDWERFKEIFVLYEDKVVSSLGFVKKSMAEFYKLKGYKTEFIMNNISLDKEIYVKSNTKNSNTRIGLYASGNRWVKNFYNQLCATSLIKNAIVDCVPINNKVYDFAELIKLDVDGSSKPLPREELLKKIANNDINIYVTFTECAPLLPLESLELGVPCITGNNHHYWENDELRDYLIVDEVDNVLKIYEKVAYCMKNKDKVLKLYTKWKNKYDEESKKSVNSFLNNKNSLKDY